MLKKTVTYTDYNGEEVTEDFYFNLNKAEVMELELTVDGGFSAMLKRIVNSKDSKKIVEEFKKIVLKSYGVKTPDGKRFIKSPEVIDAFVQNPAYEIIFMELALDAKAGAEFVNLIMPKDLDKMSEMVNNKTNTIAG